MKHTKFRSIRVKLNRSATAFGRALAMKGLESSVRRMIYRYESGERRIPEVLSRLARMYEKHDIPNGWDGEKIPCPPEIKNVSPRFFIPLPRRRQRPR